VLAPRNTAFEKLPSGALANLLKPESKGALAELLYYHVLGSEVYEESFANLNEFVTECEGKKLYGMPMNNPPYMVGRDATHFDSTIVVGNITASNGVIHIIDTVLTPPPTPPPGPLVPARPTIAGLASNPELSVLVELLTVAGLVPTFADPTAGPFTVFAPTNAAFTALLAQTGGTLDALKSPEQRARLDLVLKYHVLVPSEVYTEAFYSGNEFVTLAGPTVTATMGDCINDAKIVPGLANLTASNGVVHVIDKVLIPPPPLPTIAEAAQAAGLTTLVTALGVAGLVPTFADPTAGPFTVFAPSNAAFAALPDGILDGLLANIPELTKVLTYHVTSPAVIETEAMAGGPYGNNFTTLEGQAITGTFDGIDLGHQLTGSPAGGRYLINGITLSVTNVTCSNGVVHVIENVLIPPRETADLSIKELALASPDHTKLIELLQATSLLDSFGAGTGPWTVFAPTDEAFQALEAANPGILASLAADLSAQGQLYKILIYHGLVAGSVVQAPAFANSNSFTTLLMNDDPLPLPERVVGTEAVHGAGPPVNFVNDAEITISAPASNGVVHIINKVLLPPSGSRP